MNRACLVSSDVRVVRDGNVAYTTHPAGTYDTFEPLLGAFHRVTVISRMTLVPDVDSGPPMTGSGISHEAVPDYSSLGGLVRRLWPTTKIAWRAVGAHEAAFVRLPEPLSLLVASIAMLRRRVLIVNVVADPETVAVGMPPLVAQALAVLTRSIARRCDGIIYVTTEHLQRLVPVPQHVPRMSRSNVQISSISQTPRPLPVGAVNLLCVGTTSRLSKGQDILLESLQELRSRGVKATLTLIGGGNQVEWLSQRAKQLGVDEFCDIRGHINDPNEVAASYQAADIFCLLSRSEGLPRAMVEAMSYGLPSIGSAVGGIPELLPTELCLTNPNAGTVANTIEALLDEPAAYSGASQSALATARAIQGSAASYKLVAFLQLVLSKQSAASR